MTTSSTADDSPRDVFVVTAHQDDWQLFMGADVYALLRERGRHVVFIVATSGEGRHGVAHRQARLNGCVLSAMRALPSWNPYLGDAAGACSVAYARERVNERDVLTCTIRDEAAASIRMYFLHVRDGGLGQGFAPHWESLAELHAHGKPLGVCWPLDSATRYESWHAFVDTLDAIVMREREGRDGTASILAADPDETRNPGDHSDHRTLSLAVEELVARHPFLSPSWYAMYSNAQRPENLEGAVADDQRAAIYAYGGGYMATAAGLGDDWPRSWEREYPTLKNRQYRA